MGDTSTVDRALAHVAEVAQRRAADAEGVQEIMVAAAALALAVSRETHAAAMAAFDAALAKVGKP